MLPLCEKATFLHSVRARKKLYFEIAKIYSKNESSVHDIVKKEKEIPASFAVAPQNAEVMATVAFYHLVITRSVNTAHSDILRVRKRERLQSHNFYYCTLL